MQVEITLQRLCGVMAYYTYPKNEDSRKTQQYVICVPRHNQKVPDTLFVEVPESIIIIAKSPNDPNPREIARIDWGTPEVHNVDVPQMLLFGEKMPIQIGDEKTSTLRTMNVGSTAHLLSMSANSKNYVLKTVPIMARSYASSIPTIQSGRFFIQNVCEKGEVIASVMRDNHNQYSGWRTFREELEFFNGIEDTSVFLFVAGGHIVASQDSQDRVEYHLHSFEDIIWEKLDDDSRSLVNSWLASEINENVVAQDTINTLKRDVLMRNKELGLVPVDAWANDLFENMFDSNPNRMTDDEYEMVFGEER